jgi:hypothetical protein
VRARSPVGGFRRITLRADSLDSNQIRRLGAPLRASVQKIFCTSCSVCLTSRCGWFCGGTRLTRWPYPLQSRKNQTHRKPIYYGHFRAIEKISHATLRNRAVQHVAHFARFPQVARDGADVGSNAPHGAKTLVFLSRCSNANAVFAIPAGTDDIATHSWLGGQHGEEAKEDGEGSEKGRKEDQAPEEEVSARRASVFDFERRR